MALSAPPPPTPAQSCPLGLHQLQSSTGEEKTPRGLARGPADCFGSPSATPVPSENVRASEHGLNPNLGKLPRLYPPQGAVNVVVGAASGYRAGGGPGAGQRVRVPIGQEAQAREHAHMRPALVSELATLEVELALPLEDRVHAAARGSYLSFAGGESEEVWDELGGFVGYRPMEISEAAVAGSYLDELHIYGGLQKLAQLYRVQDFRLRRRARQACHGLAWLNHWGSAGMTSRLPCQGAATGWVLMPVGAPSWPWVGLLNGTEWETASEAGAEGEGDDWGEEVGEVGGGHDDDILYFGGYESATEGGDGSRWPVRPFY